MATKFVLFAPEDHADALAYDAWCVENQPPEMGTGPWALRLIEGEWVLPVDSNGNWVVAHLGPPFQLFINDEWTTIEEPAAGPEARATGVLVDGVTWPPWEA